MLSVPLPQWPLYLLTPQFWILLQSEPSSTNPSCWNRTGICEAWGSGKIPAVSLIQHLLSACYVQMSEPGLWGMLRLLSPIGCLLWICNLLMCGEKGGNTKSTTFFFFKIPVEKVKHNGKLRKSQACGSCFTVCGSCLRVLSSVLRPVWWEQDTPSYQQGRCCMHVDVAAILSLRPDSLNKEF